MHWNSVVSEVSLSHIYLHCRDIYASLSYCIPSSWKYTSHQISFREGIAPTLTMPAGLSICMLLTTELVDFNMGLSTWKVPHNFKLRAG